jgi:hypothetical protein
VQRWRQRLARPPYCEAGLSFWRPSWRRAPLPLTSLVLPPVLLEVFPDHLAGWLVARLTPRCADFLFVPEFEGYGIHGTPDPEKISKSASLGCIRLTNWNALELANHLSASTPVLIEEGEKAGDLEAPSEGSQEPAASSKSPGPPPGLPPPPKPPPPPSPTRSADPT